MAGGACFFIFVLLFVVVFSWPVVGLDFLAWYVDFRHRKTLTKLIGGFGIGGVVLFYLACDIIRLQCLSIA